MSQPPLRNVGEVRCNLHPDAGVLNRLISHSARNPNRPYYKCFQKQPNECGFFQWEDQLPEVAAAPSSSQNTRTTPPSAQRQPISPPVTPNRKRPAESQLGPSSSKSRQTSSTPNAAQIRLNAMRRATGHPIEENDIEEITTVAPSSRSTFPSWFNPSSPSTPLHTPGRIGKTALSKSDHDDGRSTSSEDIDAELLFEASQEGPLPSGSSTAAGGSVPRGSMALSSRPADEIRPSAVVGQDASPGVRSLKRRVLASEKLNEAYLFKIERLDEEIQDLREQLREARSHVL
uniref:GRF-type domain-containing protein n=1 Tax=Mycena chlorophos TaxID=658473 RepID=A0ABQ0L0G0_MYCCL|nr:predicted protein [Mycena chlorophos]